MYISVIIPARNEESNIKNTVESIYSYLKAKGFSYEIIVVENNSKDRTVEIVNSMISEVPNLELYQLQVKPGKPAKGYAVKMGMLKAKGDFRLITDADNSTSIDHLDKMMPYFDQGYDVVIGSIALKGAVVAGGSEPLWRRLFGKMGNLFIQIMAVPGIYDTQRGFKIYRGSTVDQIFPKMTIDGWGWDAESLALARKFKHKIKEVPINWKNDILHSKVSLKAYFQVLMETVQVRWNLITGKYN